MYAIIDIERDLTQIMEIMAYNSCLGC